MGPYFLHDHFTTLVQGCKAFCEIPQKLVLLSVKSCEFFNRKCNILPFNNILAIGVLIGGCSKMTMIVSIGTTFACKFADLMINIIAD
jgi:hypothetical protein